MDYESFTMKKFFNELKRRNVIKSALAYLVVAWLLAQVLDMVIPAFNLPASLLRALIIVAIIGFPCWLIFSWVYEITPEGIKKTTAVEPEESIKPQTSNRLNKIIIGTLGIVIVLLVYTIINQGQAVSETRIKEGIAATDTIDKSIAVLAFADMSPKKDQEYFSDGISEEILNLLTKLPDLKVISRTSSFSYKGKELGVKKIGEQLQVGYILEGSVRKSGNTFRITTQLVNAKTGADVWSEKYDRPMEDIFKIQDEIASEVTHQLKVSLFGKALHSEEADTEAYTLFLQAKKLFYQKSREGNANAFKLIDKSIAIDSTYAPAWSLMGSLYNQAAFRFGTIPLDKGLARGKTAAQKAITLAPKNVNGYLLLAHFEHASWNFKEANRLTEKAMRLDPNNPRDIYTESYFALQNGKMELAIELLLKTKERDPLNDALYYEVGFYYWVDGQFSKAEESARQYLLLHPNVGFVNSFMGQVQLSMGHVEKALDFVEKDDDPFWSLYRKCKIAYARGNKKEADTLLKQFVADYGDRAWPNIADVYAYRNEKGEAFKWLERALNNKDASLLEILNYPSMQNLWGDPRWNKFIDKLGLPDDHGFHLDQKGL